MKASDQPLRCSPGVRCTCCGLKCAQSPVLLLQSMVHVDNRCCGSNAQLSVMKGCWCHSRVLVHTCRALACAPLCGQTGHNLMYKDIKKGFSATQLLKRGISWHVNSVRTSINTSLRSMPEDISSPPTTQHEIAGRQRKKILDYEIRMRAAAPFA